jgi:hypothetical protein
MPLEKGKSRPRDPTKKYNKGDPRPHVWLCGEDPYKHSMYIPWLKAKAQANYRDEGWDLSFDNFYELWRENWHQRGREADDVVMTREDVQGPWDKKNTILMTRKEHLQRQGMFQRGKKRGPRNGKRN